MKNKIRDFLYSAVQHKNIFCVSPLCWLFSIAYTQSTAHGSHFVYVHDIFFFFFSYILLKVSRRLNKPSLLNNNRKIFLSFLDEFFYVCYMILSNSIYPSIIHSLHIPYPWTVLYVVNFSFFSWHHLQIMFFFLFLSITYESSWFSCIHIMFFMCIIRSFKVHETVWITF